MFWTRPKTIIPINRSEDFWNTATKWPSISKVRTFLIRCQTLSSLPFSPVPKIYPCRIIGEPITYTPHPDGDEVVKPMLIHDFFTPIVSPFESIYYIENMNFVKVRIAGAIQLIAKGITIDDISNPSYTPLLVDQNCNAQVFLEDVWIKHSIQGNNIGAIVIHGGQIFSIKNVLISRYKFPTPPAGTDVIVCDQNATGTIDNVQCSVDNFTSSYLVKLNADVDTDGVLICRGLRAESSIRVLYLSGKGRKMAIGEDIIVGGSLNANGVKCNDGTLRRLRLHATPAGAGAIDLSNGGRLFSSFIYSTNSNGAVEADRDCKIKDCEIDVPTSGRLGINVVDAGGATRGYFNNNKGYGSGNHLQIAVAISDFTAKFNSNCTFVNPKTDFAYNS